ncbi:DUF4959 domain-containing protein [Prolixibacteraceae bacterium JC049]|nr:DUF4959 domain-containing protein [Prolixibacteraceae bacterium JC049]
MMKIIYYLSFIIAFGLIYSCTENKLTPLENDSTAPGKIDVLSIKNGPGEALISYNLPNDDDLLYVKATYAVNGKEREVKSSYFNKQIQLLGFNEVKEYQVKLVCIDRSNNEGDVVTINVAPEEAPVFQIFNSLSIESDWGGVKYAWNNEFNAPVVVNLLAEDEEGVMQPLEWIYTEAESVEKALRGFDPEEKKFGAVVRDRYDNYSDTLYSVQTPLFEEEIEFDESNLKVLANDTKRNSWSKPWSKLFDEDPTNQSYVAFETPYPQIYSFDLNRNVKLSRFILWGRSDRHYEGGNPVKFRLYGAKELPESVELEDWEFLGSYDVKRPSGLPFAADLTTEDKEFAERGFELLVPLDAPEVRYVRVVLDKTFGNTKYSYHSDIKLYGQNKE